MAFVFPLNTNLPFSHPTFYEGNRKMLTTATIFGAAVTGCTVFMYSKLPKFAKKFAIKHYLITDIGVTALIFATIGTGTATAALASAVAWVATSALLWVGHNKAKLQEV